MRTSTWMIDFDFDAYRKAISSEAMNEPDSVKIIRDLILSEFRYKCEQEIIKLRIKYERRINEVL